MTATSLGIHRQMKTRHRPADAHDTELEALTTRAMDGLATTEGELLVDRALVAHLVDDLCVTVRQALETEQGRTNP